MSTATITLAALLLLVGLTLIILGWRGRRIGDHRACRKCGFDLSGLAAGNGPCPECGRSLVSPRATARGRRRRRPALAALGVCFTLSAMIWAGLNQFQGPWIHRLKPLSLILFETRHAGHLRSYELGNELLRRHSAGQFSGNDLDRVVRSLLDVQGRPSAGWSEPYGDLLESAGITPDQYERYLRQMIPLTVRLRERISRGSPIPVGIIVTDRRAGANTNVELRLVVRRPTINGEPAVLIRHPHSGPPESPFEVINIRVTPILFRKTNVVLIEPTRPLEPGPISLTIEVQVAPISTTGNTILSEQEWITHLGTASAIVNAPKTASIDPERSVAVSTGRSPPGLMFTGRVDQELRPFLSVSRVECDQPLAHRLLLVDDNGAEMPVGWYTNSPAPNSVEPRTPIVDPPPLAWDPAPWQPVFDLSYSRISGVSSPLDRPIPVPARARLILRPDPWFAERTLDIFTLPTGEIDLGEVVIRTH